MPVNATFESVLTSAMQLEPQDRCRIATSLWDSIRPLKADADEDLDTVLDQPEAELEDDPALEISHEAFLGHYLHRRSFMTIHG